MVLFFGLVCRGFLFNADFNHSGPDLNNLDGIRSHETPSLSLIAKNGMIQLFAGTESLKQENFTITEKMQKSKVFEKNATFSYNFFLS